MKQLDFNELLDTAERGSIDDVTPAEWDAICKELMKQKNIAETFDDE